MCYLILYEKVFPSYKDKRLCPLFSMCVPQLLLYTNIWISILRILLYWEHKAGSLSIKMPKSGTQTPLVSPLSNWRKEQSFTRDHGCTEAWHLATVFTEKCQRCLTHCGISHLLCVLMWNWRSDCDEVLAKEEQTQVGLSFFVSFNNRVICC